MSKVNLRKNSKIRRGLRVRGKIEGTPTKPRLSVYRSLRYIYAQIIDDINGVTLVSIDNKVKDLHKGLNNSEAAYLVGKELAKEALKNKVTEVVFDRGSYKYHGRVKRLAEGAREGGLNF